MYNGDLMKVFLVCKKSVLVLLIIIFIIILLLSFSALYIYTAVPTDVSPQPRMISGDLKNEIAHLVNGSEKIAYLTFDDGPNPNVTPKVLDILKQENVKATFFVIGKHVCSYPEIVKRAYEEGHYIANHGYSHNNDILYKSKDSFIDEIKNTDLAIGEAIGIEDYCSHTFRFPNGFMAPAYKTAKEKAVEYLSEIDYTYVDWNSLNNDSMKKYSTTQLLANLKQSIKDKNTLVILMHDTKDVSDSSTALSDSIKYLKSLGYTFENFYHFISKPN